MKIKEILQDLDLGNSVAEFDNDLENYFIETETFRALIQDKGDIVAGDKGTGKTALFKILLRRYRSASALASVEIITGFNPSGNPVFQRLAEGEVLDEGQYISIWKAYIVSLTGNWILQIFDGDFTPSMKSLDKMLRKLGLRSVDSTPGVVFAKLANLVRRLTNPASAEVSFTLTQEGLPIVAPKVEFGGDTSTEDASNIIRHEEALQLLNEALDEADLCAWVVLVRLDEAFQGFPRTEIPALRALFRTYLDLLAYERIRLKLFVRKDLFRKVTQGGFVNLTHINARKIEIVWEDEDLYDLVFRRIRTSKSFVSRLQLEGKPGEEAFNALFPHQVDPGTRRPTTWSWMVSRIKDGNNVKPPRNLIDLVKKAQEAQLRHEEREPREYAPEMVIIESDSIKRAQSALSQARVEDTLLAESGDYAAYIERFRGGKAEHTEASLAHVLDAPQGQLRDVVKWLVEFGFLEPVGDNYKIPLLYRDGLDITQGKAV